MKKLMKYFFLMGLCVGVVEAVNYEDTPRRGARKLAPPRTIDSREQEYQAASQDSATLLHRLIRQGQADKVEELLQASTDCISNRDPRDTNNTPLHCAALYGEVAIVGILLRHGAGTLVNTGNAQGNTPLHLAVRHGHTKVVALLMQVKGIDVHAINDERQTPITQANRLAFPQEMLRLLGYEQ